MSTTKAKIALITGANKGIGLETARQLGKQGVHVIVGARDAAKAEQAVAELKQAGVAAEALDIDVGDSASIEAAAQEVERRHGRLDILVNNAGILLDDFALKPSEQSIATWRKTFDTNLFGLVETTQAFLPLLRKSAAGRIVNLSSILGSNAAHLDPQSPIYEYKLPAYDVSKSAVNAWTVHLAHELRDTPIKVNAVHPGSVKTDMNAQGDLTLEEGARSSVELALIGADGPTGSFSHLGQTLPW
ncbi:SDR family oxidoreductase [Frateuria defendens]|uniref:SDR family oxidoreductase n=1 Tax=Frateuria defendens TaxID=2219559 RepID=UPI00066FD7F0|nr:SDR family oxidoreductase [Frateuria defendens]